MPHRATSEEPRQRLKAKGVPGVIQHAPKGRKMSLPQELAIESAIEETVAGGMRLGIRLIRRNTPLLLGDVFLSEEASADRTNVTDPAHADQATSIS